MVAQVIESLFVCFIRCVVCVSQTKSNVPVSEGESRAAQCSFSNKQSERTVSFSLYRKSSTTGSVLIVCVKVCW